MNKELAKRIKELRIRKSFTQEELSEVTGLSLRTIQRIENGETEPLADSIKRIANALDANPEELIDWSIKEDNFFLKALNLSALTFLLFPILGILVPYIMWGAKKDKIKGINKVGRDIVNFQITWNLILFIGLILIIITIFTQITAVHILVYSFFIFYILMYLLNFFLILFNTFLLHKEKPVRYYPKIRFFVLLVTIQSIQISIPAAAQTGTTSPPIPPPGQLIDLGGWHLHLNCTGEVNATQPTVILEAGAGGFSVDWSLVQPEVAHFVRVCSYDRAGLGWSELGPHPRTMRQVVWELHELLEKGGVQPPYVLVGHSYGGILARLYAFTFPSEIASIVLDESGHERGVQVLQDGQLVRLVETATGRPVPEVKTSDPLRESDIPAGALAQIEAAARSMASQAVGPPRDKLPADAQRMRAWAFAQVKHWAANDNPFEAEELAALLAQWTEVAYPLGDMPIVVLSRGRPGSSDSVVEEEHRRNQTELLRLSRFSRQVIAEHSGHLILLDEPDLVVDAIREVVAAIQE